MTHTQSEMTIAFENKDSIEKDRNIDRQKVTQRQSTLKIGNERQRKKEMNRQSLWQEQGLMSAIEIKW